MQYAYSYHALGEVFAVVAAWCLTLEYGVSGAAVARWEVYTSWLTVAHRSWGTKLVYWIRDIAGSDSAGSWLDLKYCSLVAGAMQVRSFTVRH